MAFILKCHVSFLLPIKETQQSVTDMTFGILMVCNNPANIWKHEQLTVKARNMFEPVRSPKVSA